ncbi:LysR substrate-binding domain-containing protein [Paraburkholderia acidisoli]|uniref:LysR family transcriptional regulator n=1 Tax=Paraburkholderia acidisoli TaxID=2571748 RepID=A0A7Z2GNW7_9BURK|nr:LysR substrate-binding domain-containing protein [Paraburkholderia acidisoli]QGZ65266.1 LysR family transcriptional regulator [Paraburkholderia acidisoli]
MNVRQIEAFRLVVLRGSMTAAAEELGTSQPGISRLIAELEASTGLQLFARNGGRIQITEAGVAFYRDVERSFVGLDMLEQSAREIRTMAGGRLRVVAAPLFALNFLPAIVEQFVQRHPQVFVSLEMRSEATMQRWVSSGHYDVGIGSVEPEAYALTSEDLYRLPLLCVLPTTHRLAGRTRIMASDLRNERLILPSYADEPRAPIDRILRAAGVDQVPAIETPYAALIVSMASRGLGIGLTNGLATMDGNPESVVFLPFEPVMYARGYILHTRLSTPKPLVQEFIGLVRASLQAAIDHLPRAHRA